ncbi:MAG: hypothetical protein PHH06_02400 [Candidatus Gracilibacteria bacterium]|nr:hypothetical protein [Candidatus Gracilibacteria bacterium]
MYFNIKRIVKPDKKLLQEKADKISELLKNREEKIIEKHELKQKLNEKESKKIAEILKRVDINFSKGYIDTAKSLIIEGLAIDKYNKDLNLSLAKIYENEKEYTKGEYIYIDLLKAYKDNFEILKKLGFNLALQKKFNESINVFIEAYNKRKNDNDVLEILADLTYEMKYYKKSLKFIKLYLKQFPRNTEKLKMKGYCLELLGQTEEAIETYKRVLDLQPYNTKVLEKLKHL